jgi:ankyrin repeat protein
LKKGAQVNAVEHVNGSSALHIAVIREELTCVKELMLAGADPSIKDSCGDTVHEYLNAMTSKAKREKFQQILKDV